MLNIASERKHKNINDSCDKSTQAEARISQFYHLFFMFVSLLMFVCLKELNFLYSYLVQWDDVLDID